MKITNARQWKSKKDFAVHQSINVRFTFHRFFAWDPSSISPPQNEKKPRNSSFGFYIRYSHSWHRHARWKKRHCKMRAAYVSFCPSKERGEIVNIYYLNGQNATHILLVYRKNHGLWRGPGTVKAARVLNHKFEETSSTCNRLRSGQPFVSMENVAGVNQTISTILPASARSVSLFCICQIQLFKSNNSARFCTLF